MQLIGDASKYSQNLGDKYSSIPIEVVPCAWTPVKRWIEERHGGECVMRMDTRKCFPSITENSNYIFDWQFSKTIVDDWSQVHQNIINIPGSHVLMCLLHSRSHLRGGRDGSFCECGDKSLFGHFGWKGFYGSTKESTIINPSKLYI